MAVLHRAAWFDVAQENAVVFATAPQRATDELWAIIYPNFVRQASGVSQQMEKRGLHAGLAVDDVVLAQC